MRPQLNLYCFVYFVFLPSNNKVVGKLLMSYFPNSDDSENKTQTNIFRSFFFNKIRKKHSGNILFEKLDLQFLRNKFDFIKEMIKDDTFDIFLISECKLDASFPTKQFHIDSYRRHKDKHGGCFIFSVIHDFNSDLLDNYSFSQGTETLLLELN